MSPLMNSNGDLYDRRIREDGSGGCCGLLLAAIMLLVLLAFALWVGGAL